MRPQGASLSCTVYLWGNIFLHCFHHRKFNERQETMAVTRLEGIEYSCQDRSPPGYWWGIREFTRNRKEIQATLLTTRWCHFWCVPELTSAQIGLPSLFIKLARMEGTFLGTVRAPCDMLMPWYSECPLATSLMWWWHHVRDVLQGDRNRASPR